MPLISFGYANGSFGYVLGEYPPSIVLDTGTGSLMKYPCCLGIWIRGNAYILYRNLSVPNPQQLCCVMICVDLLNLLIKFKKTV